jgi:hypothetical protein
LLFAFFSNVFFLFSTCYITVKITMPKSMFLLTRGDAGATGTGLLPLGLAVH